MIIRRATVADIPALCTMMEALRQETAWGALAYTPDYGNAIAVFTKRLSDPNVYVVVVENGSVAGFCGSEMQHHPFIPKLSYVSEWAWWLAPELRQTAVAKQVWDAIRKWGQSKGAQGALYGRPKRPKPGARKQVFEEIIWESWSNA